LNLNIVHTEDKNNRAEVSKFEMTNGLKMLIPSHKIKYLLIGLYVDCLGGSGLLVCYDS